MKLFFKSITIITGSAVLGLAFGLLVSYAQVAINAWVAPIGNDPFQHNVTGLLHMGATNQIKLGGLTLGGNLVVNGGTTFVRQTIIGTGPGNVALTTVGRVQIQDGSQGASAMPFVTADTTGTGKWAAPSGTWGCASGSALTGLNADGTPKCASLGTGGSTGGTTGGGAFTSVCNHTFDDAFSISQPAGGTPQAGRPPTTRTYYCRGSGGFFSTPTGQIFASVQTAPISGTGTTITTNGCQDLRLELYRIDNSTSMRTLIAQGTNSLSVTHQGTPGFSELELSARYMCTFGGSQLSFSTNFNAQAR